MSLSVTLAAPSSRLYLCLSVFNIGSTIISSISVCTQHWQHHHLACFCVCLYLTFAAPSSRLCLCLSVLNIGSTTILSVSVSVCTQNWQHHHLASFCVCTQHLQHRHLACLCLYSILAAPSSYLFLCLSVLNIGSFIILPVSFSVCPQ